MPSAAGSVNESAIRPAHATTRPERQKNAVTIAPPTSTPTASAHPRSSPTTTAATTATAPVTRTPTFRNERSQGAYDRAGTVTGPLAEDGATGAPVRRPAPRCRGGPARWGGPAGCAPSARAARRRAPPAPRAGHAG